MLLIYLFVKLLVVIPFWVLLPRAGIPSWVALAAIIPFGAIALLWVLAFKAWPGDGGERF